MLPIERALLKYLFVVLEKFEIQNFMVSNKIIAKYEYL